MSVTCERSLARYLDLYDHRLSEEGEGGGEGLSRIANMKLAGRQSRHSLLLKLDALEDLCVIVPRHRASVSYRTTTVQLAYKMLSVFKQEMERCPNV